MKGEKKDRKNFWVNLQLQTVSASIPALSADKHNTHRSFIFTSRTTVSRKIRYEKLIWKRNFWML